jgi:hypothetical protein
MEAKEEKENVAQPPFSGKKYLRALCASVVKSSFSALSASSSEAGEKIEVGISLKSLTSYSKGQVPHEH